MESQKKLWKRQGLCILSVCFSILYSHNGLAQEGISIGTGKGLSGIVPIRIGVQKQFDRRWKQGSEWPIWGYWEAAFYNMNGRRGKEPGSNKALTAGVGAAVVRFERKEAWTIGAPYLELGVGLSWLSKTEIGGRRLGTHFQFEDRIGVGVRFGCDRQYDINYRAIHFSNAYLGNCNNGINLHVIGFGYWFKCG